MDISDNKTFDKINDKVDDRVDDKINDKVDDKADDKVDDKDNDKINIKVDNKTDNKIDNKIDSKIDNKVNYKVNKVNMIKKDKVKKQQMQTIHSLFSNVFKNIVIHDIKLSGSSVAARHTTLLYNNIVMDFGMISAETEFYIGLITHGHEDHARGIAQGYNQYRHITLFCPASIALSVVDTIKNSYQMGKGREYSYEEIMKYLTIYGVKKNNDESSFELSIGNVKVVTLINFGEIIKVNTKGRERYAIQAFCCYHTVDTCGYMIYKIHEKITKNIILDKNTIVEVNLTEDQDPKKQKKKKNENINLNNSDHNLLFKDISDFATRHNMNIIPSIADKILANGYILKVRTLKFPDGMNIPTEINNKFTLINDDFKFLNKYKINYIYDKLVPKLMFFGDTCSYVFKDILVRSLLATTKNVIIESTFLEGKNEMTEHKYKKRLDKRHIFLPELYPIFKKYKNVKFILIHFSACYDVQTIEAKIKSIQQTYPNVMALI